MINMMDLDLVSFYVLLRLRFMTINVDLSS